MSSKPKDSGPDNVESMLPARPPTPVSDELARLTQVLVELCPRDAMITFEYNGKLHLHVDVRRLEELAIVEATLPSLCGGIFHDLQRGMAARHSFFHRVSALVTC